MDYTETPYAEDFAQELADLIISYRALGMKPKAIRSILVDISEDLPKAQKKIKEPECVGIFDAPNWRG